MSRGVLYEERERTIDHATGELKDERVHTLVKKTTPEFIMLFTQTSDPLRNANLTTAQSTILFEVLTGGYILRDNRVDLSTGARDEIIKSTKLSRNTINKAISVFVEKGLILREAHRRTGHLLNPYIFGKGKFTDLEKLRLEVAAEFDFDKLEATRYEKTSGIYRQSRELLESPHHIVSDTTTGDEDFTERTIELQSGSGEQREENPKQQQIDFGTYVEEAEIKISEKNSELDLLREKNRTAELENEAATLRIEEMKLKIELIKLERNENS